MPARASGPFRPHFQECHGWRTLPNLYERIGFRLFLYLSLTK
jgi:hypothetical protein